VYRQRITWGSSFQGGIGTAALGKVFHFFIAFVATAVYVLTSQRITVLKSQAVPAIAHSPFSLGLFLNGVIGHAFFVGLPIALFAKKAAK